MLSLHPSWITVTLYFGASQWSLSRFQLAQKAAALVLVGVQRKDHITLILATL